MKVTMRELRHCIIGNIKADIPTMVWGSPGIGKSQLYQQIAQELGMGWIDFRATLRDPVDMRGLPLIDAKANTSRWLPPSELPQEDRDGKRGLFVMDELPQASMAMQNACYGLVLGDGHGIRCLGEYTLPHGWIPMAAGNKRSDRSGTQMMPVALRNRFAHFEVEPDLESWTAWAGKSNLHPLVLGFVRYRPTLLHKMPEGDDNAFPTPRSWASVAKIADEPDKQIRYARVASLVGEGAATEFEAFVRVWSQLPDLNQIFRDPDSVPVPGAGEPAVRFAVASALGARLTKQTIANAFRYAERLDKEFEVMIAVDAVRRDKSLKETKAFANWFVRNRDVLI